MWGRRASLSMRVVEAVAGNARGRIEADFRPTKVARALRGRAQVQAEGQVVVLKDTKWSLGSERIVEAQEEMLSACWACVREPCGSLELWVMVGGGFASRRVRRQGD